MAFNSQRLHEACKAKGILELHLLQKEAAQLKTQYLSSMPPDEMTVRQIQHSQFHVTPTHHAHHGNNGGGGGSSPCNGAVSAAGAVLLQQQQQQHHNGHCVTTASAAAAAALDYQTLYQMGLQQAQQQQHQMQQQHYMQQHQSMDATAASSSSYTAYAGKAGDLSTFVGLFKSELVKIDSLRDYGKLEQLHQLHQLQAAAACAAAAAAQKPPLQQQLMQHRLLQQKRQILQKQVAMETGLSRRQMLRQQSYKIAQQQQILPPLPLSDIESEDLLAFQAIVEGPMAAAAAAAAATNGSGATGSPKQIMKASLQQHQQHLQQQHQMMHHQQQQQHHQTATAAAAAASATADCWNTLPGSMQTCQISDSAALMHDGWSHPALYQVYFNRR